MLSSRWTRPTLLLALMACNEAPTGLVVAIVPDAPTTTDALIATLSSAATDPDGDELIYTYAWSNDADDQSPTGPEVDAALTVKGQTWTVSVVASDGKVQTLPAVASVQIANAPPTVELSLVQDRVTTTQDVVAEITSSDPDNDPVQVDVLWRRNGAAMDIDGLRVPAARTKKGDIWEVTVTPDDGEDEGPSKSLAARIINSAPSVAKASIDPSAFDERSEVRCAAQGWADADGDDEGYRVQWLVNGSEVAVPGETLSGEGFNKGDAVRCGLTPWDGEDAGETVFSDQVVASNAPPVIRAARLDPAAPTGSDAISVVLDDYDDADGDRISIMYRWSVNGREVATGPVFAAGQARRNDRVQVVLTPTDGEDFGEPFLVGPVTIRNTPPVIGAVAITPSSARTNDTLTATASVSDADGDRVSMAYDWLVDGVSTGVTGTTLSGRTYFDKGDKVTVTATPSDGVDDGVPKTSAAVLIINSAPTSPAIAISPSAPTATDTLRCAVSRASIDADGDSIRYSATWTRNGSVYSSATTTVFTGDTISSSATADGQTWVCTVWASDGAATSSRVTSTVKVSTWAGKRTFTPCGKTGYDGPSTSQCTTAYSRTTLAGEVTTATGKQQWTVPVSGTYRIEAWGAQGTSAQTGQVGGKGARLRGDFSLTKGAVLTILPGQIGVSNGCSGGGGGGSFVARGTTIMLAAAGGGGTRSVVSQNGCDGRSATTAGTGSGSGSTWGCGAKSTSTIGYGGIVSGSSWGSAGGAWSRDGAYEYSADNRGRSFTNGGRGGGASSYTAYGGFGGGGAGNGSCGGGGGGGYSGGDGGRLAGGGGSYNGGSSGSNSTGARSGNGQVTIDKI